MQITLLFKKNQLLISQRNKLNKILIQVFSFRTAQKKKLKNLEYFRGYQENRRINSNKGKLSLFGGSSKK